MKFCQHHKKLESCIYLVPIFSSLSPEEMAEVESITESRIYEKGEMIYLDGDKTDKIYVIHEGMVKLTKYAENGKEQVIRILRPGDFMGEYHLFSNNSLEENSEALKKTSMCTIEGHKLKNLMKKYPSITFKIIEEMSNRIVKVEKLLKNISIESVEKRLADKLLSLADDENIVYLDMTKKDLASLMGMSAESLSRKLSKFENEKYIKQIKNKIVILDEDALFDIE